ncbi:MAG: CvpA family protein [Bacteroidetes bacterium]|nr:MAG: CvpA family protein [Bacteroidota bacterium]
MSIIDIIILVPFAWFAYQGFKKGLIIGVASLAALILGIYAALYFSGIIAVFLTDELNIKTDYLPIISFIVTFIGVVILVHFLGKLLEKLINMVALGFVNKLSGAIFGVLKAAVFLSVLILIINHFDGKLISEEKRERSFLYDPVSEIAPFLWKKFQDLEIDDERFREQKEKVDGIMG